MATKDRILALGLAGALALVPVFEGTRLRAYKDPVGIWTSCTGHTGRDVVPGKVYTPEECFGVLYDDMLAAHKVVQSCVEVPLTPNQRSAFVSFAFNVGAGARGVKDGFCVLKNGNRPAFLRKLNAGDYNGACNGLTQWVNAAGRPLPGLVRRRNAERDLCLKIGTK